MIVVKFLYTDDVTVSRLARDFNARAASSSRTPSLLGTAAVPRRAHRASDQIVAPGARRLVLRRHLPERLGELVAHGGHGHVLLGKALGVVRRPAHERRVVDLPLSEPRHRSCFGIRTYVGPLGVVVLQLTLQRHGRHEVLLPSTNRPPGTPDHSIIKKNAGERSVPMSWQTS